VGKLKLETKIGLIKAEKLFRYIQKELGENTQAQTVRFLINVAMNPKGIDNSEIAANIGVSNASISRTCDIFGPAPGSKGDRLKRNLLTIDYHHDDRRRLLSKLSEEGNTFITGLIKILES
jgi:hypothetical protein